MRRCRVRTSAVQEVLAVVRAAAVLAAGSAGVDSVVRVVLAVDCR